MKNITKKDAQFIAKRMEEKLKELNEELGGEFIIEGGSFGAGSFTPKVKFVAGSVELAEEKQFAALAPMFGLHASDWNKEVKVGRDVVTIKNIQPRRRKYPIEVEAANGQRQLCTVEAIIKALGK